VLVVLLGVTPLFRFLGLFYQYPAKDTENQKALKLALVIEICLDHLPKPEIYSRSTIERAIKPRPPANKIIIIMVLKRLVD